MLPVNDLPPPCECPCHKCPYRLYPAILLDCPQITLKLYIVDVSWYSDYDGEPNQICHVKCPGLPEGQIIRTRKGFKLPEEYWRHRYLEVLFKVWDLD